MINLNVCPLAVALLLPFSELSVSLAHHSKLKKWSYLLAGSDLIPSQQQIDFVVTPPPSPPTPPDTLNDIQGHIMCAGERSLSRTCGAHRRTSERKTTRCGLLPGDPEDAVGHHIVLRTKATHLDSGQLPCFPGSYTPTHPTLYFSYRIPAPPTAGRRQGSFQRGAGTREGTAK